MPEEVDFLEVDRPIPGQNYVCLSFISPEKIIENKNLFTFFKFYLSMNEGCDLTFEQFKDKFEDFNESDNNVQKEFDEICDFQTNVRGVKVRGIYDTQREANVRAQVLQKMDNSFHVYVGQVGYWLPWDPCADKVANEEYLEEELNTLMKEYKANEVRKDLFYEEQKREKQQDAIKERSSKQIKNETTFIGINSAEIKNHNQNNDFLEVSVNFISEIITCIKDKENKIISGDPQKVKRVNDTWKFSRNIKSQNPNWQLIETEV